MLIFYDCDTQNDFVLPEGKFRVPGAEHMRQNWEKLTGFARKRRIQIIASSDRHFGTPKYRHLEMTELDIWGGPFPMHCMDGTPGQKKIKETMPRKAVYVENKTYSASALQRMISKKATIVIEKQSFNSFRNPNTAKILKMLKVNKAVLYGVATDYALRSAAMDMRRLGIEVHLVTDAIKAMNVKPADGEISIKQMYASGVQPTQTEKVLRDFIKP